MEHGGERLDGLIRRIYGRAGLVAPHFYTLIAALPRAIRRFATTNYDGFLEQTLAGRKPVAVVRDRGLHQVSEQRPVIYKLHGDASEPQGCVITSRDYDQWESTTGHLPAQITTLFLQTTVVAIGYQAQDANLRRVVSAVNRRIRDQGHLPRTMYVVLPDPRIEDFAAYSGPEIKSLPRSAIEKIAQSKTCAPLLSVAGSCLCTR